MTRITLGREQGIALGGLVALLCVVSIASLINTRVLKARFDETTNRTVVRLRLVYDLRALVSQTATAERDFVAAAALGDRASATVQRKRLDAALAEAQKKAADLHGLMRIESGRQAAANLQQLLQRWRDVHDEAPKPIAGGKPFQTDSFTEQTSRLADDMRGALDKILSNQQTFLQEDAASANRTYGVATLIVMALILVSFFVGGKGTELHQLAAKLDEKVRQRTAELTRSEARLMQAQELAQAGSWEWDVVGNTVIWSDESFRIFGFAPGGCTPSYEQYLACVHPDDRHLTVEWISSVLAKKASSSLDNRIIRPDGEVRAVHGRAHVVLDDSGNVVRVVGTTQDITERKRVEAALRESEERFRDLFENASDLIHSVGPDGRFLFVNRVWKETLGYTEEDISRLTMFDVLDDSCEEHCQEMFHRLMAGEDVPHMQAVFVGKHGRRVSVEGSVNCRFVDGRPVATRGIFHDVTERKRAAEAEARLVAILEATTDLVSITDLEGRLVHLNRAGQKMLGIDELADLTRYNLRDFHDAANAAVVLTEGIPTAMRDGAWSGETVLTSLDGHAIPISQVILAHNAPNGELAFLSTVARDITERKRFEADLQQAKDAAEVANRAKSDFLATMSHEIRTPMNGVIGAVGLLLDGALTRRQRELATIARSSAHSLLTLINDILDISRIEAGKMPIEQAPFDLLTTLEHVGEMFAERAEEKKIELVLRYAPGARRRFVGDEGRIRQVLVNLVGNAIKFSEIGSVLVSVGEGPIDEHEPLAMLRVAIEDTGIGISPEAVGRLFERFAQADASTTRRFGGTGLGLAICKRLVELMGGAIGVTSRVGEGSTFWFTLPLLIDASPAPAPAPVAADMTAARVLLVDDNTAARHAADAVIASPARPRFQGRVLVADDNTTNQRVAQLALEGLGCHVELARNGADALAMLQQRPYDLVFMDCEMPEVDGFEATREIRALEARLARGGSPAPHRRIPVVAMTAKVLSGDREKCLAAGMDDYLSKPVQLNTLLEVLERWLPVKARPGAGESSARTTPRAESSDIPHACAPAAALDRAAIDRLMTLAQQTTPALFVRVLDAFLSDAPKYLTALHAAAARRDPVGLGRAAHALKGASLNVGAPTMAEMSRQLETVEEAGGLADIAPVLAQLESEFQRVKTELERELDQEQAVENTHR